MEQDLAIMRKRAGRLLAAGAVCETNIQNGAEQCYVSIPWENNQEIPYQEAIEMGYSLNREALEKAIVLASEQQHAIEACNFYLGELGKILDIPYFRDRSFTEPDDNERAADLIYNFLLEAVKNPIRTGWRQVSSSSAQDFANSGSFVVGSTHSIPGVSKYGHIALVAPDFLPKDLDLGKRGPWIRDAHLNAPHHAKMSVRASYCFRYSETPGSEIPIWVIWEGQDWLVRSAAGRLCTDWDGDGSCDNSEDEGTQPPDPGQPYCVSCPPGYHCVQNPGRCEADDPVVPA
jgi:hypothetical protein